MFRRRESLSDTSASSLESRGNGPVRLVPHVRRRGPKIVLNQGLVLAADCWASVSPMRSSRRARVKPCTWIYCGRSSHCRRNLEVVLLRDFAELTIGEMAQHLDMQVPEVKSRLIRHQCDDVQNGEGSDDPDPPDLTIHVRFHDSSLRIHPPSMEGDCRGILLL